MSGSAWTQCPAATSSKAVDAGRFTQRAEGYDYTLVNGTVLVDHGELTGERPGRVVTASLSEGISTWLRDMSITVGWNAAVKAGSRASPSPRATRRA